MKYIFAFVAALLIAGTAVARDYSTPPKDGDGLFVEGSVIPADSILLQVAGDGRIGFLQGSITIGADGRGTYRLSDVLSANAVLEIPVAIGADGVISVDPRALPDDLAAVVFQVGCGRWWEGRQNYWRLCRGRENCGGSDGSQDRGRRWCTQFVSRDGCESQGNCPENDSAPSPTLFKGDLPLALRPDPNELRYCCGLQCTDPLNPSSCNMKCTDVPSGPCAQFTVNCPGTIGEGGCTWD